jgi:hypothetical protein
MQGTLWLAWCIYTRWTAPPAIGAATPKGPPLEGFLASHSQGDTDTQSFRAVADLVPRQQ